MRPAVKIGCVTGGTDIWPPLKQCGWQSWRNRRWLLLIGQRAAARNSARVSAEQEADLVLRLLDHLLDSRDALFRGLNQLFALPNVQERCETTPFPVSDELQ